MILKWEDSSLLNLPEEDLEKVEISRGLIGFHLKSYILILARLSVPFIMVFNNAPKRIVLFIGDIFMSLSSSVWEKEGY